MKTGLVTFHAAHHYGAMLQAYALCKTVGGLSGHCETVDYRREDSVRESAVFQSGFSPAQILKNAHSLLHYPALERRHRRFAAFAQECIPQSPVRYTTYGELESKAPAYDRYVCGSDQIWNPFIYREMRFDPAYFARFAPGKPKIAYAPSFGPGRMGETEQEELRKYLKDFTHLSAREPGGAALLRELTGREAAVTLDPTLLLAREDWAALAHSETGTENYVLCYFVSDPSTLTPYAATVKARCGAKLWQLAGRRRPVQGADKVILDAGPREFLSLFQNAAFVLTNSFHGTVFALQFGKPFLCTAGSGEGKDPFASRMGSLLQTLGLEACLLTPEQTGKSDGGYDPEAAAKRLQKERERSLSYLRDALA